jgi:diacylglycerol kinase (ATP)
MKIALVINPRSGKRKAAGMVGEAQKLAAEGGHSLTIHTIAGAGDGTRFAQAAVQAGMDRVISVGGDGTLNAIAVGLIGTGVPLAIVPMGSGNGYARSLGLPLNPSTALRHAFTGTARPMDVCYLNNMPFLGTAGIGFDARVAHRFDRSHSRGMLGYARIILQEILGAPPMPVELRVHGELVRQDLLMLVFCNTREFGNGADISPGSRPDDGIAELRLVRKPPFLPLLKAFIDIYTHRADRNPYVRNIPATEATVHQQGTLAHLDGEPVVVGHALEFRLEKARLHVVA